MRSVEAVALFLSFLIKFQTEQARPFLGRMKKTTLDIFLGNCALVGKFLVDAPTLGLDEYTGSACSKINR